MIRNDYKTIAKVYEKVQAKPDKQQSTLPSLAKILSNLDGKVGLDLGCGKGTYTRLMKRLGAKQVYGIDNCTEMISSENEDGITYLLQDLMEKLPAADIVLAPYLLNYAESTEELTAMLKHVKDSLNDGGRLVAVFDDVMGAHNKQLGAVKTFVNEGASREIVIKLWAGGEQVCELTANYFTKEEIEECMQSAGFVDVEFLNPVVPEGIQWKEYKNQPDLIYVSAKKSP